MILLDIAVEESLPGMYRTSSVLSNVTRVTWKNAGFPVTTYQTRGKMLVCKEEKVIQINIWFLKGFRTGSEP